MEYLKTELILSPQGSLIRIYTTDGRKWFTEDGKPFSYPKGLKYKNAITGLLAALMLTGFIFSIFWLLIILCHE